MMVMVPGLCRSMCCHPCPIMDWCGIGQLATYGLVTSVIDLYLADKNESKALSKIAIPIVNGYFIDVYIWPDKETMYAESGNAGDDYAARYVTLPYKKDVDSGHMCIGPKFGEIHLVIDEFGAGFFAHELQHFILDWIYVHQLDFVTGDNEPICQIVGDMTSFFWEKFYALYKKQEP